MNNRLIIKIIKPSKFLDGNNGTHLVEKVCQVLQEKVDLIVIDFKDVIFMDSLGLNFLVSSLKKARLSGVKFVTCSMNNQIKMLLKLTNMEQVFSIFRDPEEIKEKFLQPQKIKLFP